MLVCKVEVNLSDCDGGPPTTRRLLGGQARRIFLPFIGLLEREVLARKHADAAIRSLGRDLFAAIARRANAFAEEVILEVCWKSLIKCQVRGEVQVPLHQISFFDWHQIVVAI